jgi:hypothetical protein
LVRRAAVTAQTQRGLTAHATEPVAFGSFFSTRD